MKGFLKTLDVMLTIICTFFCMGFLGGIAVGAFKLGWKIFN